MAKKIFLALLMSCLALFASASNYLTFTAEEDSSSFCIKNVGDNNPNVEYSLDDGETWTLLEADEEGTSEYVILGKKGDKALLRGYNPKGFSIPKFDSHGGVSIHYTGFNMRGKIAASGSVMSLIDGIGESKTIPSDYCFYALFYDCESLTQAPALPATTLANVCYWNMFSGCANLVQAPELPATALTEGCYDGMFYRCTNLVQAPALPATTLAEYCYSYMFNGCTSLVQAPELPAVELVNYCYDEMFYRCENLQKIKISFTEWSYETGFWVGGVAPTGTFYCPKELPIKYGVNRIPEGWNVEYIDEERDVAEHISDASFKAWGADGKITYIGATMPVEIYDLDGRLVKKVKGKSQSVVVPQHGIYVVKSGNVSLKVEL